MFSFNSIALSKRIYIQQAILLTILISITAYALIRINSISNEIHLIRDYDLPAMKEINEVTSKQLHQIYLFEKIARLGVNLVKDRKYRKPFEDTVNEFESLEEEIHAESLSLIKSLNEQIAQPQTNASSKQFLQDLLTPLGKVIEKNEYIGEEAAEIIWYFRKGQADQVSDMLKKIEADQLNLMSQIQDFLVEIDEKVIEQLTQSSLHAQEANSVMVVLAIIASLLGFFLSFYTGLTLKMLKQSVGAIERSIVHVATAADQSSNAISTVADGAKHQQEAIDQAVTAVDQSASVISDVSTVAEQSSDMAKEAAQLVGKGLSRMQNMIEVVNRISKNSSEISKVVEVINTIASQTNMLALNAAIEAARAGEQGKGFAVVAEQVRKLSENAKASVSSVVDLIGLASADSNDAVSVADTVNDEMQRIVVSSNETEKMMQNIATSMEQQVATIEELQHNMDTLKDIGNNNANASEEITETIIELSRLANETNREVNKFNL